MAIIKLTDTTWLNQETARAAGILRQALGGKDGKAGKDAATLRAILNYAGLDYENEDLIAIRDRLIADGIIEIVEDGGALSLSTDETEPAVPPEEAQEEIRSVSKYRWWTNLKSAIAEWFGRKQG